MEIYNILLKDKLLEKGISDETIEAAENEDIYVPGDINSLYEDAVDETCTLIEQFAFSEIW